MTQHPAPRYVALLERASLKADLWARWWITASLAAMSILVAAQVFCRYVLNDSIFWSEEVGRILLVQLTFLGSAVAFRAGAHPGMDALTRRLAPGSRHMVERMVLLLAFLFFAALAWYGAKFTWFVRGQSTPALTISRAIAVAPIPLGCALAAFHALAELARGMHRKGPGQPAGSEAKTLTPPPDAEETANERRESQHGVSSAPAASPAPQSADAGETLKKASAAGLTPAPVATTPTPSGEAAAILPDATVRSAGGAA